MESVEFDLCLEHSHNPVKTELAVLLDGETWLLEVTAAPLTQLETIFYRLFMQMS